MTTQVIKWIKQDRTAYDNYGESSTFTTWQSTTSAGTYIIRKVSNGYSTTIEPLDPLAEMVQILPTPDSHFTTYPRH